MDDDDLSEAVGAKINEVMPGKIPVPAGVLRSKAALEVGYLRFWLATDVLLSAGVCHTFALLASLVQKCRIRFAAFPALTALQPVRESSIMKAVSSFPTCCKINDGAFSHQHHVMALMKK